jgi:hypothetical protein
MGINEAVVAIEKFLLTYDGGSGKPASVQVRPSGDDIDVIKIYVDLGTARSVNADAWERACAAAVREALPETQAYKLEVRAEADPG